MAFMLAFILKLLVGIIIMYYKCSTTVFMVVINSKNLFAFENYNYKPINHYQIFILG